MKRTYFFLFSFLTSPKPFFSSILKRICAPAIMAFVKSRSPSPRFSTATSLEKITTNCCVYEGQQHVQIQISGDYLKEKKYIHI